MNAHSAAFEDSFGLAVRLRTSVAVPGPGGNEGFAVYNKGALIGYVRRKAEKVWEAVSLTGRVTGEYDTRSNAAMGVVQRHAGAVDARAYFTRDEVAAMVEGAVKTALDSVRNGCTDHDVLMILIADSESFKSTGIAPNSWGVSFNG